jgi:hypothetical protein
VERVVAAIDEIVRLVRFPGWQQTTAGEREVKKALQRPPRCATSRVAERWHGKNEAADVSVVVESRS